MVSLLGGGTHGYPVLNEFFPSTIWTRETHPQIICFTLPEREVTMHRSDIQTWFVGGYLNN